MIFLLGLGLGLTTGALLGVIVMCLCMQRRRAKMSIDLVICLLAALVVSIATMIFIIREGREEDED